MDGSFDLSTIPELDRIAYYGALFAMASVDGSTDKDELNAVLELLDLDGMTEVGQRTVRAYILDPPSLDDCIDRLSWGDDRLRFGVMFGLTEIAWANDIVDAAEEAALTAAQHQLGITDEQRQKIDAFVQEARRIEARGIDDDYAAEALKKAASGLAAVGVPVAAVYFSGSVIGLSAAGITSGLAALGLGLGMVPGIGVAIFIGIGLFWGISKLLNIQRDRAREWTQAERERKLQLVIRNLQDLINCLIDRINELQRESTANGEAVRELKNRLQALQQLLARRQQTPAPA